MEKSIYQKIIDHISDGTLDGDFSLPDEEVGWSPLRFAPGALDGFCLYHMGHDGLDADTANEMAVALKTAAKGDYSRTNDLFHKWTKEHRTVTYIDDIQKYVLEHEEKLDIENVYRVALSMVLRSDHIECVKIGLALLELFGEPEEDIKEIIRHLGLYDEFTVFAVWNMLEWENGNQEIFTLAQKTHSWGRIHAVDRLEPETNEIRHWLLTEGTVNDVVHAYSSLTCWKKSRAEEVLFGHPTEEEFTGIFTLIEGLLDEGPVPGISSLENAESILLRFVELVPEYSPNIDVYETILSIREWAEDEDINMLSVSKTSDRILHSLPCTTAIEKAVKEGNGLRLAEKLDIPFRDQLFAYMRREFDKSYYNVRYLMEDPDYVAPVLRLLREKLPLAEMKGAAVDDPCMGEEYKDYDKLQFLIQELDDKPLIGLDFIKAALESPASRNRYRALVVLQSWVQAKGIALSALLPEIYEVVRDLRKTEKEEKHFKMIDALIEGCIEFSEEKEDFEIEE